MGPCTDEQRRRRPDGQPQSNGGQQGWRSNARGHDDLIGLDEADAGLGPNDATTTYLQGTHRVVCNDLRAEGFGRRQEYMGRGQRVYSTFRQ